MRDHPIEEWCAPGASFNFGKRRMHVHGVLNGIVVLKFWRSTKIRWDYKAEELDLFRLCIEKGIYTKFKKAKIDEKTL